jgi:hypothetical protein
MTIWALSIFPTWRNFREISHPASCHPHSLFKKISDENGTSNGYVDENGTNFWIHVFFIGTGTVTTWILNSRIRAEY